MKCGRTTLLWRRPRNYFTGEPAPVRWVLRRMPIVLMHDGPTARAWSFGNLLLIREEHPPMQVKSEDA